MTREKRVESEILELFPEFRDPWESDGNLFREDDGSFTLCGLCRIQCFCARAPARFQQDRRVALFAKVETWIASDNSELDEAVATCFLENLAGERLSSGLRPLLGPKSLEYFEYWDHGES